MSRSRFVHSGLGYLRILDPSKENGVSLIDPDNYYDYEQPILTPTKKNDDGDESSGNTCGALTSVFGRCKDSGNGSSKKNDNGGGILGGGSGGGGSSKNNDNGGGILGGGSGGNGSSKKNDNGGGILGGGNNDGKNKDSGNKGSSNNGNTGGILGIGGGGSGNQNQGGSQSGSNNNNSGNQSSQDVMVDQFINQYKMPLIAGLGVITLLAVLK